MICFIIIPFTRTISQHDGSAMRSPHAVLLESTIAAIFDLGISNLKFDDVIQQMFRIPNQIRL
jgi:hypothetical protein